jgi:hypothetical protein
MPSTVTPAQLETPAVYHHDDRPCIIMMMRTAACLRVTECDIIDDSDDSDHDGSLSGGSRPRAYPSPELDSEPASCNRDTQLI